MPAGRLLHLPAQDWISMFECLIWMEHLCLKSMIYMPNLHSPFSHLFTENGSRNLDICALSFTHEPLLKIYRWGQLGMETHSLFLFLPRTCVGKVPQRKEPLIQFGASQPRCRKQHKLSTLWRGETALQSSFPRLAHNMLIISGRLPFSKGMRSMDTFWR